MFVFNPPGLLYWIKWQTSFYFWANCSLLGLWVSCFFFPHPCWPYLRAFTVQIVCNICEHQAKWGVQLSVQTCLQSKSCRLWCFLKVGLNWSFNQDWLTYRFLMYIFLNDKLPASVQLIRGVCVCGKCIYILWVCVHRGLFFLLLLWESEGLWKYSSNPELLLGAHSGESAKTSSSSCSGTELLFWALDEDRVCVLVSIRPWWLARTSSPMGSSACTPCVWTLCSCVSVSDTNIQTGAA